MNTISYRDLKAWYTENADAKALAAEVFGDRQPSNYSIGFYSAPSWNWAYQIGLVNVQDADGTINTYEVVTQFGGVVAARRAFIPTIEGKVK